MAQHFAMEFDSQTRQFTRRDIEIPELELGQVLIEVTCCTICGSDLHTFCGRRNAPEACVLGHEIIGNVVGWGGASPPADFQGELLSVGQRVTWAMAVGCGKCFFCLNNLSQKCESSFKYGHASGGSGVPAGGLSHYCILVAGTPIFRIPEAMPDEVACPANCATATVSAAMRLVLETHTVKNSNVLVIGAGMLGLTAAAQLCDAGAAKIAVCDIDDDRLERAKKFGATDCVKSLESDELSAITDERGFDVVMDYAGMLPAVEGAIKAVRIGGVVLLAGSVFPAGSLLFSPEMAVRNMLTIRGLHNYLAIDLADGLDFLERTHSRFPFAELVSKSFSLDNAQHAFEFARDQKPVRTAVQTQR